MGCADYYLVSYALAHKCTIVTHETPDNSPNRIKIPDVCAGLGVARMRPYAMLKAEGAKFVMQYSADDYSGPSDH